MGPIADTTHKNKKASSMLWIVALPAVWALAAIACCAGGAGGDNPPARNFSANLPAPDSPGSDSSEPRSPVAEAPTPDSPSPMSRGLVGLVSLVAYGPRERWSHEAFRARYFPATGAAAHATGAVSGGATGSGATEADHGAAADGA